MGEQRAGAGRGQPLPPHLRTMPMEVAPGAKNLIDHHMALMGALLDKIGEGLGAVDEERESLRGEVQGLKLMMGHLILTMECDGEESFSDRQIAGEFAKRGIEI